MNIFCTHQLLYDAIDYPAGVNRMAALCGFALSSYASWFARPRKPFAPTLGARVTLVPIRPRSRGERRSLRTFPFRLVFPVSRACSLGRAIRRVAAI